MELSGDEMRIVFRALRGDSVLCQVRIHEGESEAMAECYRDRATENDALFDRLMERDDAKR